MSEFDIVYSDHGSVYSANKFKDFLEKNSIKQSMSAVGKSMNNHPIEYWFSVIKEELLRRINIDLPTVEELKTEIDKYILWYN
ncbi:hypothetical protein CJJ23_04930, partial [Mycoplasmopsis agassizii]